MEEITVHAYGRADGQEMAKENRPRQVQMVMDAEGKTRLARA